MIAVINNTATPEQIHHFVSWVEEKGLSANVSQGTNETNYWPYWRHLTDRSILAGKHGYR